MGSVPPGMRDTCPDTCPDTRKPGPGTRPGPDTSTPLQRRQLLLRLFAFWLLLFRLFRLFALRLLFIAHTTLPQTETQADARPVANPLI